ncbi:MAG: hypothetical protein GQ474_07875 [Sulfurimonas sp.]|nr:hypothetical protein [Sulfurimonas sp.]
MPDMIIDGTGSGGYPAKIGSDNRLWVRAIAESQQHTIAHDNQEAFQVIGTTALSSGTVTALHIKNGSVDKDVVITYLRHQIVDAAGGTAFPNASNYFTLGFNRTYSTGGTLAVPVNTNSGSVTTSQATVYEGNPTLSGTAKELDRWYTKADGDMNTFNKDGALILRPNQTMELSYVGDHTSGLLYTRLSYVLVSN